MNFSSTMKTFDRLNFIDAGFGGFIVIFRFHTAPFVWNLRVIWKSQSLCRVEELFRNRVLVIRD